MIPEFQIGDKVISFNLATLKKIGVFKIGIVKLAYKVNYSINPNMYIVVFEDIEVKCYETDLEYPQNVKFDGLFQLHDHVRIIGPEHYNSNLGKGGKITEVVSTEFVLNGEVHTVGFYVIKIDKPSDDYDEMKIFLEKNLEFFKDQIVKLCHDYLSISDLEQIIEVKKSIRIIRFIEIYKSKILEFSKSIFFQNYKLSLDFQRYNFLIDNCYTCLFLPVVIQIDNFYFFSHDFFYNFFTNNFRQRRFHRRYL